MYRARIYNDFKVFPEIDGKEMLWKLLRKITDETREFGGEINGWFFLNKWKHKFEGHQEMLTKNWKNLKH